MVEKVTFDADPLMLAGDPYWVTRRYYRVGNKDETVAQITCEAATHVKILAALNEGDTPEPKRVRVLVAMEGGLVQAVLADTAAVDVGIFDYDTEGAEPHSLTAIPQLDDCGEVVGYADAYASIASVEVSEAFLPRAFAAIEAAQTEPEA